MTSGYSFRAPAREWVGLILILSGETLLAVGMRPAADFYFPLVWFGYVLALDGVLDRLGEASIYKRSRSLFWLMIPVSAFFWWVFELFDVAVGSWGYVNTARYQGIGYVLLASISFSTVLLAVWETATCVRAALPARLDGLKTLTGSADRAQARDNSSRSPNRLHLLMWGSLTLGIVSIVLPVLIPRYAFGLVWMSLFFLLDPVNYWIGRPSLLAQMARGQYRIALSFALGALVCGFFWESWNYWAPLKWVYHVPFVSQFHLFEMPVPGYSGYLPFGLELYAMANFILPPVARMLRIDPGPLPAASVEGTESALAESEVSIPA